MIGTYSVASLAPVGLAALIGYLVAHASAPLQLGILSGTGSPIAGHDLVLSVVVGLIAAALGIALMRGVALCEALFVKLRVPSWLRPAIGGLVVGLLALASPQIMSSGHGALHLASVLDRPVREIALVLC